MYTKILLFLSPRFPMKPAGLNNLDSLYFNYPHFSPPSESTRNKNNTVKVAIVGAGPIGMTAALAIAKHGINVLLLDNKASFNDGSRAICIARSSFYILEQIGAVDPFLDKALPWTTGRTFYQGQQILEFSMPDSDNEKYRPMYNLQQQYIEQYLWQAVEANQHIETRWQSEVIGINNTDENARLTIKDSHGSYTVQADWVLACDGARSSCRKMLGHRLQGNNYEGRYVIADIQMQHEYPTIRRALFDPPSRPGGTVLIHKQPQDIWRVDYQLDDSESTEEALLEDNIRRTVTAVLNDINYRGTWELEWWSVYTANTLALEDYRDRSIFFVGDSAHIVPIFGVRGLNNGLADAMNIGWKLAWVLKDHANPALLNSYTPERRGATLDVFANATKSTRFMTPSTPGWKLMRDAALSLALNNPFAGELANPRQMKPFTYSTGNAVLADDNTFTGGPGIGAMLSDKRLPQNNPVNPRFVSDLLGNGFTVFCFNQSLSKELNNLGYPLHQLKTVLLPTELCEHFAADQYSAYLVRPDAHIAGRWFVANVDKINTGLQCILANSD